MIVGTEAKMVQVLLDTIIDGFARMGVKVNRDKMKWILITGSQRVNHIQHGAYCNTIQGGPKTYFDRGLQRVVCPVCLLPTMPYLLPPP